MEMTARERARALWTRMQQGHVGNEEVGLYHERMRAMIAIEIRAAVEAERERITSPGFPRRVKCPYCWAEMLEDGEGEEEKDGTP